MAEDAGDGAALFRERGYVRQDGAEGHSHERFGEETGTQAVYTSDRVDKRRFDMLSNPLKLLVPRGGIEPPTLRFSVACSTN